MNSWQSFYIGVGLATLLLVRVVLHTMKWKRCLEREEKP